MDLVVSATSPAPSKAAWHDPNPQSRGEWSGIYELVTTWFCSSHDFNKGDNFIILYQNSAVELVGQELKYLGPSLRSAASLLSKAFGLLLRLLRSGSYPSREESTPGIWVYPECDQITFRTPLYSLQLGDQASQPPEQGTLFCFDHEGSQQYYAPGTRTSQGLVWYLQRRSL